MHAAGAECVFACEIDKLARQTYESNFKHVSPALFSSGSLATDITKVGADTIPDFDILCAGFPCQAFSITGKRQGFEDPRGQMIFEIIRILKEKQPRVFILENVKGLLSHDNGKTFATITSLLQEAGYFVHYKVLKACDYGVPQFRPRVFIVGFKEDVQFEFPKPVQLKQTLSDILGGRCTKDIAYTLTVKGLGKKFGHPKCIDSYLVGGEPKRIGLAEAKKLMGLPGGFVFSVSHTQAMKQIGNGVVVPVVKAVATEVLKSLQTG